MGRSDGGLLGPQHITTAEADDIIARSADHTVKVVRDAIGQLCFVAPCGCMLSVDPSPWSRRRPDPAAVEAIRATWVAMVDHVLRGTDCPEGGRW